LRTKSVVLQTSNTITFQELIFVFILHDTTFQSFHVFNRSRINVFPGAVIQKHIYIADRKWN